MNVHLYTHTMLDIDEEIALRFAVKRLDQGKGCVTNAGWINECKG